MTKHDQGFATPWISGGEPGPWADKAPSGELSELENLVSGGAKKTESSGLDELESLVASGKNGDGARPLITPYREDVTDAEYEKEALSELDRVEKDLADKAVKAVIARQKDLVVGRKPGESWDDYLSRSLRANVWRTGKDLRNRLATDDEIADIERVYPDFARPLRQQRNSFYENAKQGAKNVVFAVPSVVVGALEGSYGLGKRLGEEMIESYYTDQPVSKGLSEAFKPTLDFGEEMAGSLAESGVEMLRDPGSQLKRDPIEFLGNVSAGFTVGSRLTGGAARGAQRVGATKTAEKLGDYSNRMMRVADAMEPVTLAAKGVRRGAQALADARQTPWRRGLRDVVTGLVQGGADAPPKLARQFHDAPSDAAKFIHERRGVLKGIPDDKSLEIYKAVTGDAGVGDMRLELVRDLWSLDDPRAAKRVIRFARRNPEMFDNILAKIGSESKGFADEISALVEHRSRLSKQLQAARYNKKGDIDTSIERGQFKESLRTSIKRAKQWEDELSERMGSAWEEIRPMVHELEPQQIDQLRKAGLGKSDALAQEIVERQAGKHVRFVTEDGRRLDDIQFMGPRGAGVDPNKVTLEISTRAPQAVYDYADKILDYRRMTMELEEMAHDVELGGGKRLLARETIQVRRPEYMSDVWEPEPFAGFNRGYGKGPSGPSRQGFTRSWLKNKLDAAEKGRRSRFLTGKNVSRAVEIDLTKKALTIRYNKILTELKRSADRVPYVKSQKAIDDLGWQYNDTGSVWWTQDPATGHFWVRDTRKGPGGYVVGAASDVWVRENAYKLLKRHAKAATEFEAGLNKLVTGTKFNKVILGNIAAHVMQYADNTIFKVMVDGTGTVNSAPSFRAASAAMKTKSGDLYETMARNGIIHDFPDVPAVSATLDEIFTAPGRGRLSKAIDAYYRLSTQSRPARAMLALWIKNDTYGKTALVYRWAQKQAREMTNARGVKVTVDDVLRETATGKELGRQARDYVERFYPDYRNVPELLAYGDKWYVLPFVRYSTWSYGRIIDSASSNGMIMRPVTEGGLSTYDTASQEDRDIINAASEWTRQIVAPLPWRDDQGRRQYINLVRWTPFAATPEDALRLKRGGMFGADLYSQRVALETSGLLDLMNTALKGETAEFQRPLTESQKGMVVQTVRDTLGLEPDSVSDQIVSLGDYVVKFLMPSTLYTVDEKLLPAIAGRRGSRGRELSWKQAAMSIFGLKIEPADVRKMRAWTSRSFKFALEQLRRRRDEELRHIKKPEDREKWVAWYSTNKERLIRRRNMLLRAKY